MLPSLVLATLVAQSPALVATPSDALIDERVAITVSGLPAHTQVTLRSYVRTDSVTWYVAQGVYVTDGRGEVRLERDASRAGSYTGIDAMGLFWSGRKASAPTEPVLQSLRRLDPPNAYQVALTVSVGDTTVATTVVTRRFESPAVRSEEVRAGDVVGRLFLPRNPRRGPAVIVLGGSEGGYESSSYQARLLAAHGFIAFAQAYFRADGLPDELASVPVERVQRGIHWLKARREVGARPIALIAHSRGTELALLSAGRYPEIRAVVVSGTSAVSGAGLTRSGEPHREAAWTMAGRALPVMQVRPSAEALAQFSKPDPVRLRLLFEPALSDARSVRDAAIPVTAIRADVLIISGLDDHMGPADVAGDMLLEWLARAGHQGRRTHLKYPEAGHVIGIPYTPTALRLLPWRFSYGGTPAGYARADVDSWAQLLGFLRSVR